jgi:4-hydroxy-tetrahydrodipicolinate synthase
MITGSLVALVTPMHPTVRLTGSPQGSWWSGMSRKALTPLWRWARPVNQQRWMWTSICAVIRAVIKPAAAGFPVIAGTGANSTREAIELTKEAKEAIGADACLLVTPYYNKPTQEGLFRHHLAIAEAVAIPQILYNVPGRTGVDMSNATVARLAGLPNIVGIKDATGNVERGK